MASCRTSHMEINIHSSAQESGCFEGCSVGKILRDFTVKRNCPIVVNFAATPSQDYFLAQLVTEKGINWANVYCLHLDEYADLPKGHPNTCQQYLKEHFIDKTPIPKGNIFFMNDVPGSPSEITEYYSRLTKKMVLSARAQKGIYIACVGVGVNGQIAFNEPCVNFKSNDLYFSVKIDEVTARQHFDDYKNHPDPAARYTSLDAVPRNAMTISCAGILEADIVICGINGVQKASAVKTMLEGNINESAASLLRTHSYVRFFLDAAATGGLCGKPRISMETL